MAKCERSILLEQIFIRRARGILGTYGKPSPDGNRPSFPFAWVYVDHAQWERVMVNVRR